jgi:hypothetical protein
MKNTLLAKSINSVIEMVQCFAAASGTQEPELLRMFERKKDVFML